MATPIYFWNKFRLCNEKKRKEKERKGEGQENRLSECTCSPRKRSIHRSRIWFEIFHGRTVDVFRFNERVPSRIELTSVSAACNPLRPKQIPVPANIDPRSSFSFRVFRYWSSVEQWPRRACPANETLLTVSFQCYCPMARQLDCLKSQRRPRSSENCPPRLLSEYYRSFFQRERFAGWNLSRCLWSLDHVQEVNFIVRSWPTKQWRLFSEFQRSVIFYITTKIKIANINVTWHLPNQ